MQSFPAKPWNNSNGQSANSPKITKLDHLPFGSIPPQEGDRIEIISDLFSENEGVIDKIVTKSNSENVIYRVTFPDQQGAEWRVSIDSLLIKNIV